MLVTLAVKTFFPRLEVIVVVRVALTAREEEAGRARDVLLEEAARKARPVGGPFRASDDVGMSGKIQDSYVIFAVSRKSNEAHRVIRLGTATRQREFRARIGDNARLLCEIAANECDRLGNVTCADRDLGVGSVIECHHGGIGKAAVEHVDEDLIAQSGRARLGIGKAGTRMLMESGDQNMIGRHTRALAYQLADLSGVIELDADVVRRHKNDSLLADSQRNGVEIEGIERSVGKTALIISRKIVPEGRRDINSCKSCF